MSRSGRVESVLIPLMDLKKKYDIEVTGIIHAGAHLGEEAPAYRQLGVKKVVWIEADPKTYKQLRYMLREFPSHQTVNAVVSDRAGQEVKFNVANNGESSSILELGTHKTEHPEVRYVDEFQATTTTLDQIAEDTDAWDCNMLNLDLQGAELLALRGAEDLLGEHIEYVYSEVNAKLLYKGCPRIRELDRFLVNYDLVRVETEMTVHGWGDAFYIKSDKVPKRAKGHGVNLR